MLDDAAIAELIGDADAASDPVDEAAGDAASDPFDEVAGDAASEPVDEVDLTDLPDDAIDNLPTEEELADLIDDLGDLDISDPPNVLLPPEPEYCPYEDE